MDELDVDVALGAVEVDVDVSLDVVDVDEGTAPPEPDEHAAISPSTVPTASHQVARPTPQGLPTPSVSGEVG